ncbi:MAG: hypothetical protein ACI9LG_001673 [Moritella dasanensis]|jgi:hypothetical protein
MIGVKLVEICNFILQITIIILTSSVVYHERKVNSVFIKR